MLFICNSQYLTSVPREEIVCGRNCVAKGTNSGYVLASVLTTIDFISAKYKVKRVIRELSTCKNLFFIEI